LPPPEEYHHAAQVVYFLIVKNLQKKKSSTMDCMYTVQYTLLSFINTILYILYLQLLAIACQGQYGYRHKSQRLCDGYILCQKQCTYFMVWWNINYRCTCCLYGAGRNGFACIKIKSKCHKQHHW
jgi:hypothetical protein